MAGNAGLFDIRAAFEWTRRYIVYFGGDPQRIFTAGQGSGASVAMLLAQSDFTSGIIFTVFYVFLITPFFISVVYVFRIHQRCYCYEWYRYFL